MLSITLTILNTYLIAQENKVTSCSLQNSSVLHVVPKYFDVQIHFQNECLEQRETILVSLVWDNALCTICYLTQVILTC